MKKIFLLLAINLMLMAEVGKITALIGKVEIIRDNKTLIAKNGSLIEEKDKISTTLKSRAQIIFNDETVITIGQNSVFEVKEYFYEQNSKSSKSEFGVAKGFFKAITGQIGKISQDKFKIKTKTATIGIRGTTFMGAISDKFEKIACTRGEISVRTKSREVNVKAGEMTTFKIGEEVELPIKFDLQDLETIKKGLLISTALAKKIESITLTKELKPDEEKLRDIMFDIKLIVDIDLRALALDMLENKLNEEYELWLESQNTPIDVSTLYPNGYDGEDGLKWGFYKNLKVEFSDGIFKTEDGNFASIFDLIEATGSKYVGVDLYGYIELWRDGIETDIAEVATFMSYDYENQKIYEHWEGEAESKKVASYSGKILGTTKYLNNYSLIKDSKVNLTLDFGNRFLYGYFDFSANEPNSEKIDKWKLSMASIGSYVINPSGFYPYPWDMSADGSSVNVYDAEAYYNRYYGEGAKQISGYFQISANDEYIDEASYYEGIKAYNKDAVGLYIANQDSIFELKAREVSSDDYFSWGYWARDDLGAKSDSEILNSFVHGAWIKPNSGISETPKEIIDGYIQNSVIANYSGEVLGTVHYPIDSGETDLMKNGNIALNFDFAKNDINGKINFDAGNDNWRVNINSGEIAGNSFNLSDAVSSEISTVSVDSFEGNGKFYGNEAERIGGGFIMNSSDSKVAIGAFKAIK